MDRLPVINAASLKSSSVPTVVVRNDAPAYTVVAANAAYGSATGLTEGAILGEGLFGGGHIHSGNSVFDTNRVIGAALAKAAKEGSLQELREQPCFFGPSKGDFEHPRHWDFEVTPLSDESGEIVMLQLQLTDVADRPARSASDALRFHDEAVLLRRGRMLMAVADFMGAMLEYEKDDWNKAIDKAFGIVGEAVEVDRVYYFENSVDSLHGRRYTSQRIEWSSDRAEPQIDNPRLQNVPFNWFESMLTAFEKGEPHYGHVRSMSAGPMRQVLEQQEIKSYLFFPITVRNVFYGFLGFDECQREREWMPDELAFMQTLATNLSSAIEKRKAMEAVKESQRQFQSVISNLPGITYRCLPDHAGSMLFISDEVERMTGYPASDFTTGKRSFASIIHPDDVEATHQIFESLRQKQGFHLQYRLVGADGEVIWVEERGMGIYDANGKPLWVDGVIMNVTEQKKRENELHISNERFRLVMKAANEAIIDWDIVNDVTVLGNGFQDMFGYDLGAADHRLWAENIHEGDRDRVLRELDQTLNDRHLSHFYSEFRFYRADRDVAFVQLRGLVLRDEAGNAVRLVSSMLDLTETNRRISKIEMQNERLREIAWIQSHVVRAPLARIISLVDLIELERQKGNLPMDLLALVIESAIELDRIINEIVHKTADIETA